MPGYAVVDLETTGLRPSWHDRIVEIGVVHLDPDGQVEGTWETLVNPERDLGPQEIHGIAAADVLGAPTFADVAGTVVDLLRGRTFVAHNATFDTSFLRASYDGLGVNVPVSSATSLCTMRWAGRLLPRAPRTLAGCCAHAGIPLRDHHAALADAAATAALLTHLMDVAGRPRPGSRHAMKPDGTWSPPWSEICAVAEAAPWPAIRHRGCACAVRGNATRRQVPFLSRLVDSLPGVCADDAATAYLSLLDRALLDRFLSVREQHALVACARDLGIDQPTAIELHRRYVLSLARAAWADGILTNAEREDLLAVATLLDLDPAEVEEALTTTRPAGGGDAHPIVPGATRGARQGRGAGAPSSALEHFRLAPGDMVVFTGQMALPREVWMDRARAAGLVPHTGVTKKVRLVVAADPDSLSGKACKAADYGIPIVTEDAFAAMLAAMGGAPSGPPSCPKATTPVLPGVNGL